MAGQHAKRVTEVETGEEIAATGTQGRVLTLVPRRSTPGTFPVELPNDDELEDRQWRRRLAFVFPVSMMVVDAALIALAFFVAYRVRLLSA